MALNNLGLGLSLTAEDAATPAFERAGASVDKLTEKVEKSATDMRSMGEELRGLGAKLSALGHAGVAGLGLAADEARKFGKSIAEVSTLVDEAAIPTDRLYEMSLGLAETYGGDANTQAKALYQTISSGVTDMAEAQKLLATANKLAIGGVTDTFTAVDVLTSVTAAYGHANLSAEKASDLLFTTVRLGKTTAAELGATLGQIAPTAAALGISFEELSATLAAVTVQGINTAAATTGVKAAMANIIKPTSNATAEAARLGITFTAAELRAKGFKGLMDEITHSSKYNADSLSKLFESVDALNVVTALTTDNSKAFNDNLIAMKSATGATDAAFEKMKDTFDFSANLLKSKLQVALIKVGDILLPLLTRGAALLTKLIDRFNALPRGVQTALVVFVAAASAGAILLGALLGVIGSAMALAPVFEVMAGALGVALPIIAAVAAAFALGALVFIGFKDAYEKNIGGFGTFVDKVFTKVKLAIDAVLQLFSDGEFSGDVLRDLEKGNQGVEDFAVTVFLWWNRLKNFFTSLAAAWEVGIEAMGPTLDTLMMSLRGLGEALGFKKDGPEAAKDKFKAFGEAGAKVGRVLVVIFDAVVRAITAVVNVTTGVLEGFRAAGPVVAILQEAFGELFTSLAQVAEAFGFGKKNGEEAADSWRTLGQVVGFVVGMLGRGVANIIKGFAMVAAGVALAVSTVGGVLDGLWLRVQGVFNLIKGVLTGDSALMWYGFKQIVYGTIKSVISLIFGLVEGIASMIDSLAKKVGKDLGLSKGLASMKKDALGGIESAMGLDKGPPGPLTENGGGGGLQVNRVEPAAPHQGAAPPLAPATMPAAAAGAPAAGAGTPTVVQPPDFHLANQVTLKIDTATIAEIIQKMDEKGNARGFGPTATQK